MSEIQKADYTSHPIDNFRLGRFKFKKGLLTLEGDEVAMFDALLEKLPPLDRARVRKLDVAAAEAFVRERLAMQKAGATQITDSSTGERAEKAVGKGRLEDLNKVESK